MIALALAASLINLPAYAGPKLVLISWDGAPAFVIERLVREGKLPNVAKLAQSGVHAKSVIPAFPSKTAVGHAAIFTGAWGDVNGITNNSVPRTPVSDFTILETRSGFDSRSLTAEPAYITLAKAGWKVAALSATQAYPAEPHVENLKRAGAADRYVQYSGFESELSAAQMIDVKAFDQTPTTWRSNVPLMTGKSLAFTFKVADNVFFGMAYDSPDDPKTGLDTVALRTSKDSAQGQIILKPHEAREDSTMWSKPVRIRSGERQANTAFRLFELAADGSSMALYTRKASALPGANTPEQLAEYLDNYPGFHDDAFTPYQRGLFGKPYYEGGSGQAEERLLEVVQSDCDYLTAGIKFALNRYQPDALFHYTPMSDSAGHTWMGFLDPDVPGTDPKVREFLWRCYERVFQKQDAWLGKILDMVPADTVVTLVSDHGMEGVTHYANVNAILAQAGLLTFDEGGRLDLTKTQVCAPPWADFGLVVNTTDRKGGIVPVEKKAEVLRKATAALLAARDDQGNPIVTTVLDAKQRAGLGIGGAAGADAFMDFALGLYPSTRRSAKFTDAMSGPDGVHGFVPYRTKMHTIWYARGAGLASGVQLPMLRQVDIMPTLAAALGFPVPPQAIGVAVAQALKKP
ncbi:MAG: alkaline phosphatase family protein [Methanoregulaceae archaeon]|nr:alkaline phosphatase family protein [Methanoregulaceae archaeon]